MSCSGCKIRVLSFLLAFMWLLAVAPKIYATEVVYHWVGGHSGDPNSWDENHNWLVGGSVPSTYPGQSTDDTDVAIIDDDTYTCSVGDLAHALAGIQVGDEYGYHSPTLSVGGTGTLIVRDNGTGDGVFVFCGTMNAEYANLQIAGLLIQDSAGHVGTFDAPDSSHTFLAHKITCTGVFTNDGGTVTFEDFSGTENESYTPSAVGGSSDELTFYNMVVDYDPSAHSGLHAAFEVGYVKVTNTLTINDVGYFFPAVLTDGEIQVTGDLATNCPTTYNPASALPTLATIIMLGSANDIEAVGDDTYGAIPANMSIQADAGAVTLDEDITIYGDWTYVSGTFTPYGTVTMGSNRDVTVYAPPASMQFYGLTFDTKNDTSSVNLNGDIDVTSAFKIESVDKISGTSSAVTIHVTGDYLSTFTTTDTSVDTSATYPCTVSIEGESRHLYGPSTGAGEVPNLRIETSGGYGLSVTNTITVVDNFSLESVDYLTGDTIQVAGNATSNDSIINNGGHSTATIKFIDKPTGSTVDQTISGEEFSSYSYGCFPSVVIDKPSGKKLIVENGGGVGISGDWTWVAGEVVTTNSTVVFDGQYTTATIYNGTYPFNNLDLLLSNYYSSGPEYSAVDLGGGSNTLEVDGVLWMGSITGFTDGTLDEYGDVYTTGSDTFSPHDGTIELVKSGSIGTQTLSVTDGSGGTGNLPNVVIDTSCEVDLYDTLQVWGTWTVTSVGSLAATDSSLLLKTSALVHDMGGNSLEYGYVGVDFTSGYNGITFGYHGFSAITLAATSGTTGTKIQFASGGSQVFTFTNIDLEGTSSTSRVILRSTHPGTQFVLSVDPAGTTYADYLDVEDSDSNWETISTYNSLDSGNNTGWSFH